MGAPDGKSPSPLEALIGPLRFASGANGPVDRIGGLVELIRGKIKAWTGTLAATAPGRQRADRWLALLADYEALGADQRRQRLRRILEGVESEIGTQPTRKISGKRPTPAAQALADPARGRAKAGLSKTGASGVEPAKARPSASKIPKPRPRPAGALSPSDPVTCLAGVGGRRAELLNKLGIHTLEDLLLHLPSRYEDRSRVLAISELVPGTPGTVRGTVVQTELKTTPRRRMKIFEALLQDDSLLGGALVLRWFNQPHRARQIRSGGRFLFSGKVVHDRGGLGLVMENPEFEADEGRDSIDGIDGSSGGGSPGALHAGRVVAIYPVTEGLTSGPLRGWVAAALKAVDIPEPIDDDLLKRLSLPSRAEALSRVHRPETPELARAGVRRLAFEEFYFLQLGLALKAAGAKRRRTGLIFADEAGPLQRALLEALPFALTGAQRRVVAEIQADLSRDVPMQRLIQGDVGCGKTVVALMALLRALDNGCQGALMAPTEILAVQHHQKLTQLLDGLPVNVELLLGKGRGKAKALGRIADGQAHIVVGTQALIQDKVAFKRLGLAVVDEQHRFGVRQRARLAEPGGDGAGIKDTPHTLIMTATPIPRSLAMTVYGDLDLSVIDTLPPGRKPITTRLYFENRRQHVYEKVKSEVAAGRRAYVVHPLVEESEKLDLRAASEAYEALQQGELAGISLGLLHGRMSGEEKARVMAQFAAGTIQVLVTTTVVEVGVDVPEASVMVVEHAERFGLSQLHQLRGRVGRGGEPGFCLLVASHAVSKDGRARLDAMVETQDGFRIAEYDLEIRGPGELFGQRQSGLPELKVANLIRDAALLAAAREAARRTIAADPALKQPKNQALKAAVTARWQHRLKWGAVG